MLCIYLFGFLHVHWYFLVCVCMCVCVYQEHNYSMEICKLAIPQVYLDSEQSISSFDRISASTESCLCFSVFKIPAVNIPAKRERESHTHIHMGTHRVSLETKFSVKWMHCLTQRSAEGLTLWQWMSLVTIWKLTDSHLKRIGLLFSLPTFLTTVGEMFGNLISWGLA